MAKKTSPLLPWTDDLLKKFGDRLRLARLRRKLTAKQVAERSGMSPITLRNVENGESGVTIGAYIAVMQVLGIEKDFDLIAQKDELGRNLQDSIYNTKVKSSKDLTKTQIKRFSNIVTNRQNKVPAKIEDDPTLRIFNFQNNLVSSSDLGSIIKKK